MKVAIYCRCSTLEQHVENQLLELRRYTAARGWQVFDVDEGVSGIRESRPRLDAMLRDAKRRRFDAVLVAKLDRLGRSLKHLIFLMEELRALGVGLVSLGENIDTTTPAGRAFRFTFSPPWHSSSGIASVSASWPVCSVFVLRASAWAGRSSRCRWRRWRAWRTSRWMPPRRPSASHVARSSGGGRRLRKPPRQPLDFRSILRRVLGSRILPICGSRITRYSSASSQMACCCQSARMATGKKPAVNSFRSRARVTTRFAAILIATLGCLACRAARPLDPVPPQDQTARVQQLEKLLAQAQIAENEALSRLQQSANQQSLSESRANAASTAAQEAQARLQSERATSQALQARLDSLVARAQTLEAALAAQATRPPPPKPSPPRGKPAPPPSVTPPDVATAGNINRLFDEVDATIGELVRGNVAFNTPERMRFGEARTIALIASPNIDAEALSQKLRERIGDNEPIQVEAVEIAPLMEAQLEGAPAFGVTALSPIRQPVSRAVPTEWRWNVRANEAGKHTLHLTMNAIVTVDNERFPRVINVLDRDIEVEITTGQRVSRFVEANWQWLAGTIAIPFGVWLWTNRRQQKKKRRK